MSILEIAGLTALIVFVVGMVSMLVICGLKLSFSNSKVLDYLFTLSVILYGVAGFTAIILSFIYEIIK